MDVLFIQATNFRENIKEQSADVIQDSCTYDLSNWSKFLKIVNMQGAAYGACMDMHGLLRVGDLYTFYQQTTYFNWLTGPICNVHSHPLSVTRGFLV